MNSLRNSPLSFAVSALIVMLASALAAAQQARGTYEA